MENTTTTNININITNSNTTTSTTTSNITNSITTTSTHHRTQTHVKREAVPEEKALFGAEWTKVGGRGAGHARDLHLGRDGGPRRVAERAARVGAAINSPRALCCNSAKRRFFTNLAANLALPGADAERVAGGGAKQAMGEDP